MSSSALQDPIFSQGVGYGLILGIGSLFALGMSLVSFLLSRYMAEVQTSEMFLTANHSVKTGLVASAVVSSWTVAATLLSSTTEGYLYGVSGPFWYGAGATVQIFLFAMAAIEMKRKAPKTHTFHEIVRRRYGIAAHIILVIYAIFLQLFTTVASLVGGSTLYASLTGINSDAACFLLPLGVMFYTFSGGIKATFITDWVHTVVIYVIMLAGLFVAYTTSDLIGSPSRMYDLLTQAAELHPVEGNESGSYLTMKSSGGGYIGLIFAGAGFAGSVDGQLFQKAIAADPTATLPGYILGGLCWFTIPFVLASTFGLAAAATEHLPSFPTYPQRMTSTQVSQGLAMPYAAIALMGKGGAISILIMAFMAITSFVSSEMLACAGIATHDIYKTYFNPKATGKELIRVSHCTVIVFGIVVSVISIIFNHVGFSVNFLISALGIFVDSAVIPLGCTVMWKKQSRAAVILAPILSSIAALVAWFMVAYTHYGEVTISSCSETLPLVAGNMMSFGGPILLTPLITYIKPENYDWNDLANITTDRGIQQGLGSNHLVIEGQLEVGEDAAATAVPAISQQSEAQKDNAMLKSARNKAAILAIFLCLAFCILWPIPMYGSGYIFSRPFFTGWVAVVFIWAFLAAITITCLPIIESWRGMFKFIRFAATKRSSESSVVDLEQVQSSQIPSAPITETKM